MEAYALENRINVGVVQDCRLDLHRKRRCVDRTRERLAVGSLVLLAMDKTVIEWPERECGVLGRGLFDK